MALSNAVISFDISDMLGVDFDARRTRVYVTTNVPDNTVIDTVGNKIRVGGGSVAPAADGTGTLTVWAPGTGSNPDTWETYVNVDYPDPASRLRKTRTFGPFTVTGNADLADLVEEQEVPPTYLTTVTTLLDGYVSDAEAAEAGAEAARDAAIAITGISTSDAAVEALVKNTGGAGPLTSTALSASYGLSQDTQLVPGAAYTLTRRKLSRGAEFNESAAIFATPKVGAPGGTFDDPVINWGYNVSPAGARRISTEPMFRIGMEGSWWDAGSSRTWSELHLGSYVDKDTPDGLELRPLSIGVVWGGDSGRGSPSISMCVTESASVQGLSIYSPAGAPLAGLTSLGWTFNRDMLITHGAGAPSQLTVGEGTNDAVFTINGTYSAFAINHANASSWLFYDGASINTFYFRDQSHGRMHISLTKGTTNDNAYTDFNSMVRVYGFNIGVGASQQVQLGMNGTSEGWLDCAVTLNLRAQSGSIKSLTSHLFSAGAGFWGHAAPGSQPAAPTTLADVIAIVRGCGLSA